jgi:hypothetical protein
MIALLIINLITLIVGIVVIIHVNKIRRNKWIEFMVDRISLENINLTDCFSKDVVSIYISVLNETNKFSLTDCLLKFSDSDIYIWASNSLENRRFYTHNEEKQKEVDEMNKKLTHYDKLLLDKLVKAFKNRQDKLVTKFFV